MNARGTETKAAPPSDVVEWELWQAVGKTNPAELRSIANVYRRWADQCERAALWQENILPTGARN